jgi:hypothetical protein
VLSRIVRNLTVKRHTIDFVMFTPLILGWFLGLLAPLIQNPIKRKMAWMKIRQGILTEATQIQGASANVCFIIYLKSGILNREFIQWYRKATNNNVNYGLQAAEEAKIKSILERLINVSDSEIQVIAREAKADSSKGLNMKDFDAPYIRSKLGQMELFPETLKLHVLNLLHHISIINQQIDEVRFFYKMTFDSNLSKENHEILSAQCHSGYGNAAQQAKLIADICDMIKKEISVNRA